MVLALGCGIVAAIGITQVMDVKNRSRAGDGETQPVFVAMNDIAANEELDGPEHQDSKSGPRTTCRPAR